MRRDLDPTVQRSLDELDRALAGDPAAEPDLALLVADVRAAAPGPGDAFVAELDRRVAARFPAAEEARAARPRRALVWRLAPAGGLAAGLVALVVVLGGNNGDDAVTSSAAPEGGGAAALEAERPAGAPEPLQDQAADQDTAGGPEPSALRRDSMAPPAAGAAPTPGATAFSVPAPVAPTPSRPGGRRAVQRAAELTLTPDADEVQDVADDVVRTTQSVGGYVQTSDVDVRDGAASASLLVRVPAARLDDALARLSRLAEVGALRQQSEDITGAVESAAGRLSDARAERRALLRALGRATTEREIRSLRARLADSRRRIARDEAALDRQRRRADLATVAVTVTGRPTGDDDDEGGTWTPGDALGDAWRVLQVLGGALVVGLAALLPVALLALLARLVVRRRREAVLGG